MAKSDEKTLSFVMLGDIVGRSGRMAVEQQIPAIRERWNPDLIIANAENSAQGQGLTPKQYTRLCRIGIDAMTLGDHVYKRVQIVQTLEAESNIIRPANLADGAKGKRWMRVTSKDEDGEERGLPNIYVITVLGRVFMSLPANDPFATVDQIIKELPEVDPIVLVEVHAEATSEKQAMGWHLDGRASAVLGTHTHVPTADARILPNGTAFMCDIGMCGPHDSVIGRRHDRVLTYMTTAMPAPFDVSEENPRVNGAYVEIDVETRRARKIEQVQLAADPNKPPFVA